MYLLVLSFFIFGSPDVFGQTALYSETRTFTSNWTISWNVSPGNYILKVSGVYADGVRSGAPQHFLDAAYDFGSNPVPYNKCPTSGSRWRYVDSCSIRPNPDIYTDTHVYYYGIVNRDGTVNIDFNDQQLGDNSGSLTFELYGLPSHLPPNGLVGWWPFNGNANDESGKGNNGTVYGLVPDSDRFGKSNSAFFFNGTDGYINVDRLKIFNSRTFSVCAWVRGSDYSKFNQIVSKNFGTSVNESINLVIKNVDNWNVTAQVGGKGYYGTLLKTAIRVPENQWQFIVYTFSGRGSLQKIYVNGELAAQNTANDSAQYDSETFTIGTQRENGVYSYFFKGQLDDIGLWDRALSDQEVVRLYNGSGSSVITDSSWTQVSGGNCLRVTPNSDSSLLFLSRATDVLKSSDQGSNWTSTNWTFPIVRDGYALSKGGAFSKFNGGMLALSRFDNGWALSSDNGNNYTSSGPQGFGTAGLSMLALDDGRFLATRGGFLRGIYKSSGTDNATWNSKVAGFDAYDFTTHGSGVLFSSGYNNTQGNGIVLKSTDRGETWASSFFPTYISDVEVVGDSILFFNSTGEVRISSIENVSNSLLRYNFNFSQDVFNFCTYSKAYSLLAMSSSTQGLFLSKDKGFSWVKHSIPGVSEYRDVTIVGNRIFIATDKGLYARNVEGKAQGCTISAFNPLVDTLKVCGDTVVLDAKSDYSRITWSNGASTRTVTAKVSGRYRLTVQDQLGCTATDSVYVSLLSAKISQNDTTLCTPGSIRLSAAVGVDRFVFNGILYQTSRQRKSLPWGPEDVVTGATSATDGASNTRLIVDKLGSYLQGNYAARYCDTLSEDGFDDWFLPASQETRTICSFISTVSALGAWTGYLHTSTEQSARDATRIYVAPPYGCGSVAAPFKSQSEWFVPVRKAGRLSFRWSTGDTTQNITVNPTQSSVYILTVSDGLNSCNDTFRVSITQGSDYNPFPERIYSRADSILLDAGGGQTSYRWSTGATARSIFVRNSGGYRVNVTNPSGCTATDSVFVQFADTVGLVIPNVTAACNRSVDVPVRATAFRNLLTMQGSVNWNAAYLRFDSIASFGPAALSMNPGNFGLSQISSGRLTFSWNDAAGKGVSLLDSSVLFTLRFTAIGTGATTVPVTLSGNPTPLEFYEAGLVRKSFNLSPGAVNIACELNITGKVLTPSDNGVRNVSVTLSGGNASQRAVTDSLGNYSFKTFSGSYTLSPEKNNEKNRTNGVSTIDLALIQSHILQTKPLDAPYKVIAADADNSSSISTVDIVFLRRLILGVDTSLPGNRTWAFVDADQTFANGSNPFPFNYTKALSNLTGDVSHRFRAIKVGDVNYDRNPMLDQAPSGDTLRLYYDWTELPDGGILVSLKTRSIEGILGYQTGLKWEVGKLELEGILSNPMGIGIGERWKDEGYLTLSWNDIKARGLSHTDGFELLQLRFRKSPRFDKTILMLDSEKIQTEAFNSLFQSVGVRLTPSEIKVDDGQSVLRLFPNPAGREVTVEWRNERRGEATIRLIDAIGRVTYVHNGFYEAGLQRHVIHLNRTATAAGSSIVQVVSGGLILKATLLTVNQYPKP